MLQRIATVILLVPLFLNGLWMVCANEQAAADPVETASEMAEAVPLCDKMCPVEKPTPGAICLISSNGGGASLVAILFVVAPPPANESLSPVFGTGGLLPEPSAIYSNPILAGNTPPPKA